VRLACIHTHTTFCDGKDDVETCCRVAYNKGLLSLGFSAHAPVTRKTGFLSEWHLRDEKLEQYLETVRAAQKRWMGKLPVFLGLEVDFVSGIMGPADSDYKKMDLDFIIGSVHYTVPPKGEPFTVDDSAENVARGIKEAYGGDPLGMVEAYWNAEEAMIRAGGFDLLGHPDVVKKNNSVLKLFSEDESFYHSKTRTVAALTAEAGIPAEVNTGGLNRGKIKDCYPSRGFLKLFRENGVPMVINSDAHRADDLDGHYEDARKAMLDAGYTETIIFEGRRDGKPVWKKIQL
jgi:histidinol-phosphatase (PHP family)